MHELSVAQALLERAEAMCRAEKARAVRRIQLRVGELAGIEKRQLAAAFAAIREGTLCAHATLAFHDVAAVWSCPTCRVDVPRGAPLRCPTCGRPAVLMAGDALLLERVELEVQDV